MDPITLDRLLAVRESLHLVVGADVEVLEHLVDVEIRRRRNAGRKKTSTATRKEQNREAQRRSRYAKELRKAAAADRMRRWGR